MYIFIPMAAPNVTILLLSNHSAFVIGLIVPGSNRDRTTCNPCAASYPGYTGRSWSRASSNNQLSFFIFREMFCYCDDYHWLWWLWWQCIMIIVLNIIDCVIAILYYFISFSFSSTQSFLFQCEQLAENFHLNKSSDETDQVIFVVHQSTHDPNI